MSKTRDTGFLANVIQVHDTGVRIMSGSTMLMAVSSSGAVTITGEISGSDAANALLLSGTGSVGFTTTSSFLAVSSSQQEVSASYISLSGSYNTFSGSASTRITVDSASLLQVSASYIALSGSYTTFSGSASTRITVDSASLLQVSASQQQISSSLLNVISIFATTGSNSFRANQSITGSLVVSSTITAQTLVVQTVTSSIVYSSGSNIFGCDLNSRQTFTGSVNITGSSHNIFGNVGIGITPNITAGITELAIGSANTNPLISGIRDGACAFSLSSDSAGTKLFERRNLELTIGTNNTTRMYITNGGNVGIAVNPPAWRTTDKVLQVNNSALFDENGTNLWLGLNFYENSCGNYIFNNNGFATAYRQDTGTHKFFISNNGTAGCTASLSVAFQIASTGAATFGSSLTINGAVNVNGGSAININAQNCFQVGADAYSGGFYVYDNCAAVYRFKIANGGGATFSGGVTIGTTLTTSGNITANSSTIYAGSNNTTRIQMSADTIEGYYGGTQYWALGRDSWGSGCAALALGGTSRYALIGAAPGGDVLRMALGSTIGDGATCSQYTFSKGQWTMLSSSGGTNFYIGYGSGKTTIGMDSGGTCGIFFNMYSGGYADRFYVLANGNYYFSGSPISDIRTKENICAISMNALNKLNCLVPKSFNTIGYPNQKRYGFIAQEVKNILPDIISGNEETETIGLDYNSILSLTVKAIQEQQCTINTLKTCLGIS